MKKISGLLIGIVFYYVSFSQISFTGSSSSISTGTNAANVVVDDALTITASTSFTSATVSVSSHFYSGDILSFTTSLLPPGVSGSYNATKGILTFSGNATASAYQTLLRSVTFQPTAAGVGDRIILFSLGNAFFNSVNTHFYQYIPGSLSWIAAKADAASRNYYGLTGYLATITSLQENQFIQQLGNSGWIGASDEYSTINAATGTTTYANQSASEGKFYWVTGPEAGTIFSTGNVNPSTVAGQFSNWNSGEPNNWAGNEHYASIYTNGAWNDGSNPGDVSTSGYIIEYGGTATDPVVDLIHSRTVTVGYTSLSSTPGYAFYQLNQSVYVDYGVNVSSGGMLTNARITISGGFASGDVLSFSSTALPAGVSGSFSGSTGVLSFTGTASPADWQNLFRTITFKSTSSSTADRTVSFSFGNLISGSNGHFYQFIPSTTNWSSAKTAAEGMKYMGLQGYLATVTSKEENDLIWQKLSADGWLGGSDEYSKINAATGTTTYANQAASEGNFYWVTGPEKGQLISTGNYPSSITSVSFSNWYNGEPNNYNNNEHYIEIYSSSSQPGTWNDLPVNNNVGYVVEYGGLPTDPNVVLSVSRTLVITTLLPVGDFQFNVEQKNNLATLNWSSDEKNVTHYEIQHSTDGITFTKIGDVTVLKNAQSKYSFTDSRRLAGKNFYRLVIIENNGSKTLSIVRTVIIKGKISLTPSRVHQSFTITQPITLPLSVSVLNASGALVFKKTINQQSSSIDASFLKSGFYFVIVTNDSKGSEPFIIIKE